MAEDKVIDLGGKEIDPAEAAAYRDRVRAATQGRSVGPLKGSEPLGGVPRPQMPVLRPPAKETVSAPAEEGVSPRPKGSPILRQETAEQLQKAIEAGQEQQKTEEKKVEDEKASNIFSNFDFGDLASQADRILDNKKRREVIETRCDPMNFEDLLIKDEVRQRVPILPGKFEPCFRSITPIESLFIKKRMAKETVTTDQYMGEKYNLLLLTCCLVDINGLPFPDHLDQNGEPDDKLFDEKLRAIMRKSGYIIADLSVNYMWFDIRVRKLINPDALGNG